MIEARKPLPPLSPFAPIVLAVFTSGRMAPNTKLTERVGMIEDAEAARAANYNARRPCWKKALRMKYRTGDLGMPSGS